MTKTDRYTFTDKAMAQKFYNSLSDYKNLYGRTMCYNLIAKRYEVTHTYKVEGKEGK